MAWIESGRQSSVKPAAIASRLGVPLLILGMGVVAWRSYGWSGVAFVLSVCVLWALLHVNRMMQVLKRAAARPIGSVASAVMFNARLKAGVNLLHVTAMTRSLGERRSATGVQPEIYRWTDAAGSHVTCEFQSGRLVRWLLERPAHQEDQAAR